jgi:hypothetical protein
MSINFSCFTCAMPEILVRWHGRMLFAGIVHDARVALE